NSLRKTSTSWLGKILLGILIIPFVIWGIGDIFRGVTSTTLAEVGDREISPVEFQRDYNNQINSLSSRLGRQITPQEARTLGITQNVLQNTISRTAVDIHADELGLGMSDEAIAEIIQSEPSFQNAEGAFDPQNFQAFLRNSNLSEQNFVALQRGEMIRGQIMSALSRGAYVPDTLLNAVNHHRNDERAITYFVLDKDAVPAVPTPDETVLKAWFEENKARYKAPEYRKVGVLALTQEAVKDTITLSDADLQAYFETQKDQFNQPERRKLQQLVFPDRAAADEAYKKLEAGEDFVELGKSIGMTDADIALGEFTMSDMADKTLAEAAFALDEGGYSAPVESFSTVIVRAEQVTAGESKSFEDIKDEVRDRLALDRALDEIQSLYDTVEDERAAGADVRGAASKLNLQFAEYTIDRNGSSAEDQPVEDLAGNREAIQTIFTGDVGIENNPVQAGEGYLFIDVLEVIPERDRTLEEVRAKVVEAWIEQETRTQLRARAEELVEKGKAGSDLEALANEREGVEVKTASGLKRVAPAPQGLPPSAISLAFTMTQNGYGTVQMPDGLSQAVFQLTGIKEAPALDDAQAKALRDEIRQGLGVDILTQYVAGLQNDYGVQINSEAISQLTNQ
ncbi:MAG: SurA N-terminal domain-containing protein, partial [Hyphomicrobiales bacterium]|nr:SurA N-terminal domain-containing protein [Hyphomicrobiales bacterium]